jgi:hypothetical protein
MKNKPNALLFAVTKQQHRKKDINVVFCCDATTYVFCGDQKDGKMTPHHGTRTARSHGTDFWFILLWPCKRSVCEKRLEWACRDTYGRRLCTEYYHSRVLQRARSNRVFQKDHRGTFQEGWNRIILRILSYDNTITYCVLLVNENKSRNNYWNLLRKCVSSRTDEGAKLGKKIVCAIYIWITHFYWFSQRTEIQPFLQVYPRTLYRFLEFAS